MATKAVTRAVMTSAQISKAGGDFEVVEREIPNPGTGQVRIKIQACGVCHSDVFTKEGQWPGIEYPRVPGHEVVGIIDEVGTGISGWTRDNGSASAGTVVMTERVLPAGVGIFVIVRTGKCRASSFDVFASDYRSSFSG